MFGSEYSCILKNVNDYIAQLDSELESDSVQVWLESNVSFNGTDVFTIKRLKYKFVHRKYFQIVMRKQPYTINLQEPTVFLCWCISTGACIKCSRSNRISGSGLHILYVQ